MVNTPLSARARLGIVTVVLGLAALAISGDVGRAQAPSAPATPQTLTAKRAK